ncbi:MAG TPA: iron-containing alcohol dehydrogenase [Candidatus Limiplasma sp.]|nr:iron-containing alcohol dehydrogenase [Candidatus Limiplasma sp.]
MIDFVFQNPAKIIFGRTALSHLGEEALKYGNKALLVYGGGSVKRIGLYDQVKNILAENQIAIWELGGIVPNPHLSRVREGIEICRREGIGLVLALGGGSVIDTGKGIVNGVPDNGDVWDFYISKRTPKTSLPLGTILTLPAAGSEMSYSSVITNEDGMLKRGYNSLTNVPTFSILNPEWSFTLPPYQTACGCVDIIAHMMERYFTLVEHVELTDRLITAGIQTVLHNAPIVMAEPENYDARAEVMWTGTLAHNTFLNTGRVGDWGSHKIEHELSAEYDIAHGAGLAIVFPAWMKYAIRQHPGKIAQFAMEIFNVPTNFGSETEIALEGVRRLEVFYQSLGMPIRLRDAGITNLNREKLAARALPTENAAVGEYIKLHRADIEEIYKLAE